MVAMIMLSSQDRPECQCGSYQKASFNGASTSTNQICYYMEWEACEVGLSTRLDAADGNSVPSQSLLTTPHEVPSTLRPLETPGISHPLSFWGAEQLFSLNTERARSGASVQFHTR